MNQEYLFEKWKLVSEVTARVAALFQNDFELYEKSDEFDPQMIKNSLLSLEEDIEPLIDSLSTLYADSVDMMKDWDDRIEAKSLPTKYVGGTFCESIKCPFNEDRKAGDREYCATRCKAFEMHEWLDKNGYKITKERNK